MILTVFDRESFVQLYSFFVAMAKGSKSSDPRLKKAAQFYAGLPEIKLHEAMLAAGFSSEEAYCRTWQMQVRRRPEYKRKKDKAPVEIVDVSTSTSLSTMTISTTSTKSESKSSSSVYRAKTTRLLPHQVQTKRNNERKKRARHSAAHKAATAMYDEERKKSKKDPTRLSAAKVAKLVNDEYGTNLTGRTISRYCSNDMAGKSPVGMGPVGKLCHDIFTTLAGAMESIRINQVNGNGLAITRKNLIWKVNAVVAHLYSNNTEKNPKLLERLLKTTDVDLSSSAEENIEDRRHQWTTFTNLNLWFEVWESNLV